MGTILYGSSLLFLKDIQSPSDSVERSIFLFMLNIAEVQMGFAFFYRFFDVVKSIESTIDYIYFSITNNGELIRQGYVIGITHNIVTFYMISTLMSFFISGLKPRKYVSN